MRCVLCLLGLSALPLTSHAQIIYKCVDEDGGTRFTNIAAEAKGCQAVSMIPFEKPPAPTASSAPSTPRPQSRAAPPATPANFPRIDRATQQARDSDRRRILEQELGLEQKLLEQARQELAADQGAGSQQPRIEAQQKRVRTHEENVSSLRREISNLR
jgi:hypothetical protein